MSVGYSTNLQLVEPVTGSEAGNWGYDINYGTTDYIDIAIAGTNNLTTDADVTLSQTVGTTSGNNITGTTAQYMQLLCSGARTAIRYINAPNLSKMYVVNNSTTGGYSLVIRGVTGPTTGVSVSNGEKCIVYWSSVVSDFVKIASINGSATYTTITSGNFIANESITGALSAGAYSYGTLSYSDTNIFSSFSTSVNSYAQSVLQNTNSGYAASTDFIVSNNSGTATTYFGDFGINSSGFGLFSGTGSISNGSTGAGTTLNIATVVSGGIQVGSLLTGTGITAGTYVTSLGTGTGGVGTYTVNNSIYTGASNISITATGGSAISLANNTFLTATSGDLAIGTTTNNAIHFVTNSGVTDSATISAAGAWTFNYAPTIVTDATIHGLTVGLGGGSVSTNTAVGASALSANTSGANNLSIGYSAGAATTTTSASTYIGANSGLGSNAADTTAVGSYSLYSSNTGAANSALGKQSLYVNTTGAYNTGLGTSTLISNTTGSNNVAVGNNALNSNTTASNNTAVGYQSLYTNTSSGGITGIGYQAGYNSSSGFDTYLGYQAGYNNTSNGGVTALGYRAGYGNGQTNCGDSLTAVGVYAAYSNAGSSITAVGASALYSNTTGANNTAVGYQAGYSITTASPETAVGYQALYSQTTQNQDTAVGYKAAYATNGGYRIDAFGYQSLTANTTGHDNSAFGANSLQANTTGTYNVAVGVQALTANTTASNNTAVGYQAGYSASASNYNVFIGQGAGYNANYSGSAINTFVGTQAGYYITSGIKNTIIGNYSGNFGGLDIRTSSNYIVLSDGDGNPRGIFDNNGLFSVGTPTESISGVTTASFQSSTSAYADTVHIGNNNTSFANAVLQLKGSRNTTNNTWYLMIGINTGVNKILIADSGSVTNATGTYGTISDIKLKENIVDATPKLADICKLQVRNFNLKTEPTFKQLGFIAQEVEQVFPAMIEEHIDKDADGNDLNTTTKSVKTSVLVPMLVKAIQELKAEFDAYKATHP